MNVNVSSPDFILFAVIPYIAIALFVWGTIQRLQSNSYSVSSGSSQFLENRRHFWTIVPFHYGVIVVLVGHLVAIVLPQAVLGWNAAPLRLYALEVTGLVFGLLACVGFAGVVWRRLSVDTVRATTERFDWIVYGVLLLQLAGGVGVAINFRWGSSWFASILTPYLWSVLLLRPDIALVAALPFAVKLHIAGAFVLGAVFPFSRLVHVIYVPNGYFWRRPLVMRWYRPLPR